MIKSIILFETDPDKEIMVLKDIHYSCAVDSFLVLCKTLMKRPNSIGVFINFHDHSSIMELSEFVELITLLL